MIGLILDTNVLVSANLNSDGLEALVVSLGLNRKVQLYVSEPILAEYEQVLLDPPVRGSRRPHRRSFCISTTKGCPAK
jgi:predicted nucleic acid-binding protein